MITHHWECECGEWVDFRQPELPRDDYNSEQNAYAKTCPRCGEDMWFDDDPKTSKLIAPPEFDAAENEKGPNK